MNDRPMNERGSGPSEEAGADFEPRRNWILRAVVVAAVALVVGFVALRPSSNDAAGALPSFELESISGGETIADSDLEGRPAVVNFWASWCDPCRREMPLLDEFAERYEGRVTIVGVDVQDTTEAAQAFLDEVQVGYPIVSDLDQELFGPLSRSARFGSNLPQTFFVAADGTIVAEGPAAPALGELEAAELEEAITFLLDMES